MAIIPMKKITVVGLQHCKSQALLGLQKSNVIHIISTVRKMNEQSAYAEESQQAIAQLKYALSYLKYTSEVPKEKLGLEEICKQIRSLNEKIAATTEEIRNLESNHSDRKPWGEFDTSKLEALRSAGLYVQFYVISPKELQASKTLLAEHTYQVVFSESGQQYVIVIGSKKVALKGREFPAPTEPLSLLEENLKS